MSNANISPSTKSIDDSECAYAETVDSKIDDISVADLSLEGNKLKLIDKKGIKITQTIKLFRRGVIMDFIQEQLKDYYENHKADLELVLDK